jgi:transposase InsO family protein
MLNSEGWQVNHKRVERLWRREGLKVPAKQPKRGRLWLTDGSCVRLRPASKGHVWSYDFMAARTRDGRPLRLLTVIDEYTREGLAIYVAGSFNGKLRDELLNPEIFDTLLEAQVLVERWRRHYNAVRPHSSLGYRPPAPEGVLPWARNTALSRKMTLVRVT